MRPIGRLTAENWVAHLVLILAAAAAAAVLAASRAEGELLRKVITVALGVLAVILILQTVVESAPGAPRSYRIPYPICAAASIIMIVGQSMQTELVVGGTAAVSASLFAIGITVLAFQVRGLGR
jgi:drug/metabolite transporter (DMT)-like permease